MTTFHVFSYLNLPGLLVYPLVGLIIGPSFLSLVQDINLIYSLADFGVIFLMFAIGLEFSLSKLLIIKKYVFILGFFQVAVTIAIVFSILFIFKMIICINCFKHYRGNFINSNFREISPRFIRTQYRLWPKNNRNSFISRFNCCTCFNFFAIFIRQ